MALTDYELKLRGRSWCNNLKQNGIIKDDITLQNCMSAFPMSGALAHGASTAGEVLQVQPPSNEKQSYNFSIYEGQISNQDTTGISPTDNDRFLIYNQDKNYLTYDDNPFGANYASVNIQINSAPETFEWVLINRGDNIYSITGSNNKFLSIDIDKHLVVASGEINAFSTWKLGKIDEYATFESVQFPGLWLASANNDVYLSDTQFDATKWLMLNLSTATPSDIAGAYEDSQDNLVNNIQNDKTVLQTQILSLIKQVVALKIKQECLQQIKNTTSSNINAIIDIMIDKINKNNTDLKRIAGGTSTNLEGYVLESKIKTMQTKWNEYRTKRVDAIISQLNDSIRKYDSLAEQLENKKKEYKVFNEKIAAISVEIKKKMNANTQTIEQQLGKSDNIENMNKQLSEKNKKDAYLKELSQTNSDNYSQVENAEWNLLIVKLVTSIVFLIITIWLAQRAVNLYYTNF